ncbi:TPA: pdcB, partial [Escherichia coli]
MKAVITPFVQKELGVATFKVDQEVRKLVEAGRKFIMEPVPRELIEHMDDGLVVSEQTMATNEALQPFFNSDELFRRIGGIDSLVAWLRRKEGQV